MILRFAKIFGVMAAMAAGVQVAQAQDGSQVTRQAVAAMQQVVEHTQGDVQGAAATGIAAIERLDANGAEDRQIMGAAHRAFSAIDAQAHQGDRHINLIAARAVEALRQINADRRFFQILGEARDNAHDAIAQAHRRAHVAVQAALDEALDH
ncbi:MAG: hypothetical protein IPJ41_00420 [Phycisphaerales bacterium]|nr:hypothetical protein [Phycisphaerales bacterium]